MRVSGAVGNGKKHQWRPWRAGLGENAERPHFRDKAEAREPATKMEKETEQEWPELWEDNRGRGP